MTQLRALDLACNDGWLGVMLAREGHAVDLLDLNPKAVETAKKRAKDEPNIGKVVCDDLHRATEHFEPGTYDSVSCFECIEHVPSVERLLDTMVKMCKPGGRIYISTPDGAYERGHIGDAWQRVEPKGHLRAIRPADLAELLCERGVIEQFEVAPDRTICASARVSPRKGKVIFYAGGAEPLPENVLQGGQGGSETALCKVAEHFARKGYDVRVYAGREEGPRGDQVSVNGREPNQGIVLYRPAAAWNPGETCDLFISSRIPEVFDRTIDAKQTALWLHDAEYGDRLTPERVERIDRVIVLSQWQREHFAGEYPFVNSKFLLSRNGIETSFFPEPLPVKERKPWVVYSSSPDRGLDVLLECWPEIRKQVPNAELHHTYAPVYHQFKDQYPHLQTFHAKLDRLHEGLEGVVQHGSMGQKELATLYRHARCWSYPSYTGWLGRRFPEIYGITAVECQAAGVIPVALSYAALRENVVTGKLLRGDPAKQGWRRRFIDATVKALTDDEWLAECSEKGHRFAMDLDWAGVADDWERVFLGDLQVAPSIAKPLEQAA